MKWAYMYYLYLLREITAANPHAKTLSSIDFIE